MSAAAPMGMLLALVGIVLVFLGWAILTDWRGAHGRWRDVNAARCRLLNGGSMLRRRTTFTDRDARVSAVIVCLLGAAMILGGGSQVH